MNSKNILLVTNYFPPEKGAAPNRMYTLAENLARDGYKVDVVCPLPNYPTGQIFENFKGKFHNKEVEKAGTIHRLWLLPSNSENKFIRLFSMISFSLSLSLFFLFTKTPKKVFIQYSPVFVGFSAVFWSWILGKKITLNVSDLWPLAGLEMGLLNKGFYYSILEKMEHFCYRKSNLIVGQSQEIINHVLLKYPEKQTFLYRNLPNFEISAPSEIKTSPEIKIVYAGLLGLAQGISEISGKIKLPKNISLHVYGAGPDVENLKKITTPNVVFHGELDRLELHKALQQYDIAFIPLLKRIYGSVPSKIFEYTRLGLPVLYFAGGEGGELVEKESLGWVVPVNNILALQEFLDDFSLDKLNNYPKKMVQENAADAFNFSNQFKTFIASVEAI